MPFRQFFQIICQLKRICITFHPARNFLEQCNIFIAFCLLTIAKIGRRSQAVPWIYRIIFVEKANVILHQKQNAFFVHFNLLQNKILLYICVRKQAILYLYLTEKSGFCKNNKKATKKLQFFNKKMTYFFNKSLFKRIKRWYNSCICEF